MSIQCTTNSTTRSILLYSISEWGSINLLLPFASIGNPTVSIFGRCNCILYRYKSIQSFYQQKRKKDIITEHHHINSLLFWCSSINQKAIVYHKSLWKVIMSNLMWCNTLTYWINNFSLLFCLVSLTRRY